MAKGWDEGTTAEVRRMASQKIAVEMIKLGFDGEIGDDKFFDFFFRLVNKLDADVIAVGEKAREVESRGVARQVTNGSQETEPVAQLNDLQQQKMLQYLDEFVDEPDMAQSGRIAFDLFKVKLWTMQLPTTISHKELVKFLTVEQGMALYGWVKETLDHTPDAA